MQKISNVFSATESVQRSPNQLMDLRKSRKNKQRKEKKKEI